MHRSNLIQAAIGAVTLTTLVGAQAVFAWTGPSQAAPNGNVSAPINTGTTDQVKDGGLSVNSLAIYGNTILSGTSNYLNFGTTPGSTGYGIRNTSGTLEFKNSGGSWESLATVISNYISLAGQWTTSGSDIYRSSGNVGIGTASPLQKLDVQGGAIRQVMNSTYDVWLQGGASTASGDNRNLALLGVDEDSGDALYVNYAGEYAGGTYINSNVTATAYLYSSDARLKDDVRALSSGLDTLMDLRPVSFTWKEGTPRAGERDMGFIAQEVANILPHTVETSADGTLSVDYVRIVPILVAALQEQQDQIDAMRAEIDALKAR